MLLPSFLLLQVVLFLLVAAGDGAAGSIAVVDVVDLDVGLDAAMLLAMLMLVTGKVGFSYRCCWYEC